MAEFIDQPFDKSVHAVLEEIRPQNILLFTGRKSYEQSPAYPFFEALNREIAVTRFNGFGANPQYKEAKQALRILSEISPNLVIALGGGSVMDFAKIITLYLRNPEAFKEPFIPAISVADIPPLVAIPTTSGSGSEATQFAVLYKDGVKYSVESEGILPHYPVVDPALTYNMPPRLTACSGIDAVCQAIEALWAVKRNNKSRTFARESLALTVPNIVAAYEQPAPDNRKAMALGAFYAGKAINITKTTGPHAMAYYLTDKLGIPHGEAVAINMEMFIRLNFDKMDREDRAFLLQVFEAGSLDELTEAFRAIKRKLNLIPGVKDTGISTGADLQAYIDSINVDRMSNNPASVSKEALHELMIGNLQ